MTLSSQTHPFDADAILDGIRSWVEIESPTEAPEQINKLATVVADGYRGLPATIERVPGKDGRGDHLIARSNWGQDKPGILVLSHSTPCTQWVLSSGCRSASTAMPRFGPGIYDMKGGAYLAYTAFRQLCLDKQQTPLGITQMYVSDEEIGSPTSRALIEAEGQKAKYVLVTEPARDGGKIVTGRKGVGRFEVFVKGVPAHSGSRPEDGRSAIRELGHIILALDALNDPQRGVSVNVGVIRGGTKPNVVAEDAYAEVDLRVKTAADAEEMIAKILGIQPRTEGVSVKITVTSIGRPTKRVTPVQRSTSTPRRLQPKSASNSSTLLRAAARTAISRRPTPRRSMASASTARAPNALRADVHLIDRTARAPAAPAVSDAEVTV